MPSAKPILFALNAPASHHRRYGVSRALLALFAGCVVLPVAWADEAADQRDRAKTAKKAAADAAAALGSLQDVQNQLVDLRQAQRRSAQVPEAFAELRDEIDALRRKVGNLQLQLSVVGLRPGPANLAVGYADGFYVVQSSGKFLLRLAGLMQIAQRSRLYSESRDHGNELGVDESTFLLRRARLMFSGQVVDPRLTYAIRLDFGSIDPTIGPLLEGYADFAVFRWLKLRAGRFKVPYARQFLISSGHQQFVERTAAVDAFAPGWDLGLMLHGALGADEMLIYQLGMFNGAGSTVEVDNNTDFLYAARIVVAPWGSIALREGDRQRGPFRIQFGGAFVFNLLPTDIVLREGIEDASEAASAIDQDRDGETDTVAAYQAAAELTVAWGGLAAQGELFYRREDPGAAEQSDREYWGTYGQLGYFVKELCLEIAGRYGYIEPPDYGVDRRSIRPQRVHELSVVLASLPVNRHLKWQAEYTHQWLRRLRAVGPVAQAPSLGLHQFRLQLQLGF